MSTLKRTSLAVMALLAFQILAPTQAYAKNILPKVLHRTAMVVERIILNPIDAPMSAIALHSLKTNFGHKCNPYLVPAKLTINTVGLLFILPFNGAFSDDPMPTVIDVIRKKHKSSKSNPSS